MSEAAVCVFVCVYLCVKVCAPLDWDWTVGIEFKGLCVCLIGLGYDL